jgi:hypothetical protein
MDANSRASAKVKPSKLRPTQMTLGYAEVSLKRKEWRKRSADDAKRFLKDHRFPAILGPGEHFYIVDHHHLGRALLDEKVDSVTVSVVADLSYLGKDEFWTVMDYHRWVHPYDETGMRRAFSLMPKTLKRLPDDPYRSLAAALRRAGDYPKDVTPFAEFLWADFLRRRLPVALLRDDPEGALKRAKKLVEKRDAAYLPERSGIGKS